MSFSNKIIKSRSYLIQVVTGKNYGRPAWWIVKVLPHKFEMFKWTVDNSSANLDEFGEVLYKGWGDDAPAEILQEVEKIYA